MLSRKVVYCTFIFIIIFDVTIQASSAIEGNLSMIFCYPVRVILRDIISNVGFVLVINALIEFDCSDHQTLAGPGPEITLVTLF